jgi:hypothetical protein
MELNLLMNLLQIHARIYYCFYFKNIANINSFYFNLSRYLTLFNIVLIFKYLFLQDMKYLDPTSTL